MDHIGDQEFEKFLNGGEHTGPFECQKRLLFDIIQQKLSTCNDLLGIYADLHIKFPDKIHYESSLRKIEEMSLEAFEQLEYLMSVLLEEIGGDDEKQDDRGA